jgi:hypothetical protein
VAAGFYYARQVVSNLTIDLQDPEIMPENRESITARATSTEGLTRALLEAMNIPALNLHSVC